MDPFVYAAVRMALDISYIFNIMEHVSTIYICGKLDVFWWNEHAWLMPLMD